MSDAARTRDTAMLAGASTSAVVKEHFALELAQNRLLQWRYEPSPHCSHPCRCQVSSILDAFLVCVPEQPQRCDARHWRQTRLSLQAGLLVDKLMQLIFASWRSTTDSLAPNWRMPCRGSQNKHVSSCFRPAPPRPRCERR